MSTSYPAWYFGGSSTPRLDCFQPCASRSTLAASPACGGRIAAYDHFEVYSPTMGGGPMAQSPAAHGSSLTRNNPLYKGAKSRIHAGVTLALCLLAELGQVFYISEI